MKKHVLVTGGAGFIGSNVAADLLRDGHHVTIFDSLMRRGAEHNFEWLQEHGYDGRLRFEQGDVRNPDHLRDAVRGADVIYHFAAQVAVTSSVEDPRPDFEINARGTFNVLEAARLSGQRPIVVLTSTNKVYGNMEEVAIEERSSRYEYRDLPFGVPETQPLDFHSPYGCSKGAGDQYVRDYARIYNLPAVVFRMSCIYGPRQFGNEDQGWLAHFMIAALTGKPITIYGDGKQVRDVLFVEDLVRALRLAVAKIDVTAGEVFNIGGGPANTLSVWREFGALLGDLHGREIPVNYSGWRPGDQPCYVSDIRKAERLMGWQPQVDKVAGIRRLWEWVAAHEDLFLAGQEGVARTSRKAIGINA
jgi:CDP-paratose 2-epimerase